MGTGFSGKDMRKFDNPERMQMACATTPDAQLSSSGRSVSDLRFWRRTPFADKRLPLSPLMR
jgi:hypothetical protein